MKKKKEDNKPIVNRIEVDEKTAEPIIVEVPDKQITEMQVDFDEGEPIKEADFFKENKNLKSAGKQLVMHSLGLTKDEAKSISKRQKIFSLTIKLLFIAFVVGVLVFTFINDFFNGNDEPIKWSLISNILAENWYWLFAAFGALLMCYLTKALKLTIFCKQLTGKYRFKTCFETAIIGHYYNFVTPLAVGGQPFEIYHLSKHGVHGGAAAALPIATYVLNQFAYVILGLTFLITLGTNALGLSDGLLDIASNPALTVMATAGLVLCFVAPLTVIIFSLMPRVGSKLVGFVMNIGGKLRIVKDPKKATYKTVKNVINNAQCLKKVIAHPSSALVCFLISFLEHVFYNSIAFFALMAFGFGQYSDVALLTDNFFLNWIQMVQIVYMLNLAVSFIPTPGNAGAADLSFSLLFTIGLIPGLTFIATISWRILSFYLILIIGFTFATLKKRADHRREAKLLKNQ